MLGITEVRMLRNLGLIVSGVIVWLAVELLINAVASNGLIARMLWVLISILVSAISSVKLKKSTEARWALVLSTVCLTVPYETVGVIVVSYALWAYYRWQKSRLSLDIAVCESGEDEISENQNQLFFKNMRLRYFAGWFVFSFMISGIGAAMFIRYLFQTEINLFTVNILSILFYGLLLFWIITEKYSLSFRQLIGPFPPKYDWLQLLYLLVIISMFGNGTSHVVLYAESFIFPEHVQEILDFNLVKDIAGAHVWLQRSIVGLLVVFIGPVVEEIIFRGIILQRLAIKYNLNRAIIISSFVFGILHGDDAGLGVFVGGLILAMLYVKTKSLVVPIVLHIMNNAIGYAGALLALMHQQTNTIENLQADIWQGVAVTVISLPGVLYYLRKNWPKQGNEAPLFTAVQTRDGD